MRWAAAWALETIGNRAAESIPFLIQSLQDEDEDVRIAVVMALGKMGEKAIPGLMRSLQDKSDAVRYFAIKELEQMGKKAIASAPALINAGGDDCDSVRHVAERIIEKLGMEVYLHALQSNYYSAYPKEEFFVKNQAILFLMEQKAEVSIPPLIQALCDQNNNERIKLAAGMTLCGFGKKAVPSLIQSLKYQDVVTRNIAIRALEILKDKAIPGLEQAINDRDEMIRQTAKQILQTIKTKKQNTSESK